MFAYTQQQDNSEEKVAERLEKLQQRREKLRALFERDKATQETEIKTIRAAQQTGIGGGVLGISSTTGSAGVSAAVSSRDNMVEAMKNRVDSIRSAREDSRRKLAEQKLYENWRQNNPELRQLESKKLEEHVVSAWSDQIREKDELAKIEKKETDEYLAYLELERQRQEDRDEELRRLYFVQLKLIKIKTNYESNFLD